MLALLAMCGVSPEPAEPVLSLSVDGGAETELWQGWPLLVEVLIYHPDLYREEGVRAIRLDAGREGWSRRLGLEVLDADGRAADWPLEPVELPERSLRLDAETTATAVWSLAPEAVATIDPGRYELRAVLDTEGMGGRRGFRGRAVSHPASVAVPGRPAPPALLAERRSRLARYHLGRGELESATAVVEEWLEEDPESIAAWTLAGDVRLDQGLETEALEAYRQALLLHFARHAGATEPPRGLLRRHRELFLRLDPSEDE